MDTYREFFTMPYLVMFHDTMAYGTHHFMTNFKFQCVIREHLLFDSLVDVSSDIDRSEFDKCVLLTKEGYCNNFSPVKVGEKVAIFLSFEEPTISTVRLCFRVVRYDGVQVTCGYQTLLPVSRDTGVIIQAPGFIKSCSDRIRESLIQPTFSERIMAGKTREVFDPQILRLGIEVANAKGADALPKFIKIPVPHSETASAKRKPFVDTVSSAPKTGVQTNSNERSEPRTMVLETNVNAESHPFICNHLVDGKPTFPGAFEVELVAQAAMKACSGYRPVMLEDIHLTRFIKLQKHDDTVKLKSVVEITEDNGDEIVATVKLMTDFVHESGKVLQENILHMKSTVRMKTNVTPGAVERSKDIILANPIAIDDPYTLSSSPVKISGYFRCLHNIRLGEEGRTAMYKITDTSRLDELSSFEVPSLLLDAMLRISMLNVSDDGIVTIYVPISCGELKLYGVNDHKFFKKGVKVKIEGTAPRVDGDTIYNDWVRAIDENGCIVAYASNLKAQKAGQIAISRQQLASIER